MIIVGYKDSPTRSVVAAALSTTAEFKDWHKKNFQDQNPKHVESLHTSDPFDHLVDDNLRKFKKPVFIFDHMTPEDQEKFFKDYEITVLPIMECADRQLDMSQRDEHDPYKPTENDKTLAEIHGLDKEDPWDHRTDEEKAQDQQMKEMMDELKKNNKLSGDSFSPAKKPQKDYVYVDEIRASQNQDGSITVDNVLAVKKNTQQVEAQKNGTEIPKAEHIPHQARTRHAGQADTDTSGGIDANK